MKSPAIYPPTEDPIPNQDINRLFTRQDPSLPPVTEKFPPGFKPLFNYENDPNST